MVRSIDFQMNDYPPIITIFTDAGYCPDIRRGVWACWAKYIGVTHRHSGIIKPECENCNIAEVFAIVNGFASTMACFTPPRNTLVLIQSDSQFAIDSFEYHRQNSVPRIVMKWFDNKVTQLGVRVQFRHVKGHQGTRTKRNAVNTACDRRCKVLLKQAREQFPVVEELD